MVVGVNLCLKAGKGKCPTAGSRDGTRDTMQVQRRPQRERGEGRAGAGAGSGPAPAQTWAMGQGFSPGTTDALTSAQNHCSAAGPLTWRQHSDPREARVGAGCQVLFQKHGQEGVGWTAAFREL